MTSIMFINKRYISLVSISSLYVKNHIIGIFLILMTISLKINWNVKSKNLLVNTDTNVRSENTEPIAHYITIILVGK